MRDLMPTIDPNIWTLSSAGIFLVAFIALTVWVYLPSRRKFYDKNSKLPISE